MSACKDCLHYENCEYFKNSLIDVTKRVLDRQIKMNNFPYENTECKTFMDKSRYAEVVRCEDCKHWNAENKELHSYSSEDDTLVVFAECRRWSGWATCHFTRFNDFCSCGEQVKHTKCTGKRCPMQVGYDISNCKAEECIYRTEKGGAE